MKSEVNRKFHGPKHIAIVYTGVKYIFVSAFNSKELNSEIPIYTSNKNSKVLARYEGINVEGFEKIINTIVELNEGKKPDLEKLLE